MKDDLILVGGAGGFIGGHLVADLLSGGCRNIRAVDIKPLDQWRQRFDEVENIRSDSAYCRIAKRHAGTPVWSTTWRPTWGGWALSKKTEHCVC